ncbi:F-box domain-containing protein [Caenorhabditis elegans]|uniref:F-box domain-containing protein n=1 Tax=Caenorhabditis elegans TaxID=6239 RepID=P91295_CAEEL|nr:F-box domain-containing protein [Caenorhabditis elegans]CCD63735.1 F-box domain-containing protein [Caenorhabditis elegans]|eukprot:NP_494068.1 Uncharacterized protein CELE_F36H5.9 [Caenorhabditis elegans]
MSSFSLLRLPSNELSKVLRHMDPIAQFGLSLLSENSKKLISALKIFDRKIYIEVQNHVHVILDTHNCSFGFNCGTTDRNVGIEIELFRGIEKFEAS